MLSFGVKYSMSDLTCDVSDVNYCDTRRNGSTIDMHLIISKMPTLSLPL